MPELPEVEFARTCAVRWLKGKSLARVEADRTRVLRESSVAAVEALGGHRLESIERRGKWLLWRFDGGLGLLAHLGMSGKFELQRPGEPDVKSSRVRFVRPDGAVVHYRDPRMFGQISAGPVEKVAASEGYQSLGPDAWDAPPSPAAFFEALHVRRRAVKDVLLDQTVLAGLGNIYATEALFDARIHPARPARSLVRAESDRLLAAIHATLDRSLAMNKGDKITYVEEGGVENPFVAYGRAGEPCPRCGTPLRATQIGGRTSVFCRTCQPRTRARKNPRARSSR